MMNPVFLRYLCCGGLVLLGGCGDSSKDDPEKKRNETVEEVLVGFGVDIADTPRLDTDMMPVGEDFSPLGSKRTINKFVEMELFGVELNGDFASAGQQSVFELTPAAGNQFTPTILDDPTDADLPWFAPEVSLRRAVVGDFDSDGLDETAIVFELEGGNTLLQIRQDMAEGFTVGSEKVVGVKDFDELFVESGDFDGDGDDDLAIAFVQRDADIEIVIFTSDAGTFTESETRISIPVLGENLGREEVILASGNLDRDNAIELGVVVNQPASTSIPNGSSRFFVYDDLGTALAEKASGPIVATLPTEVVSAVVGNIAVGDVDRDGIDEVVLGGLTQMGNTCNLVASSITTVLDDLRHDLTPLAANKVDFNDTRQPCASGSDQRINMYPLTLPDIDGDGALEIHSFEYVYEDLGTSEGLVQLFQIPQVDLLTAGDSGNSGSYRLNWKTASFQAGDVTSDGRDNIVFYKQSSVEQGVYIWGFDQIDGFKRFERFSTVSTNSSSPSKNQLLLPDTDLDQETVAIEYSAGSYRLLFTEPMVIAALAAPPCARDKGAKVDDACRSAFGKAVSDTMERSKSWKFIAGVSVGYEAEFSALGVKIGSAEVVLNTRNTISGYNSSAYTLTNQVIRETGVLEDSVIFSTIPLDVYTYQIVAHPNPELVGGELQVRLPRQPITIMATRDFYNETIEEGSLQMDESIFGHEVGNPASYPTVGQKDVLLNKYKGLESSQVDVGQGTGFTTVSITEFSETTSGEAYDFEATVDFRATKLGVVGGLSLGGGSGYDISTSRGEETLYQGTVANIASEFFPQDGYSFGMFSYIIDDSANPNPFEVIKYWVVPSN